LQGDGLELLQPVLHRLAEVVAALAERGVALFDEAALLPRQRQRRAMAVGGYARVVPRPITLSSPIFPRFEDRRRLPRGLGETLGCSNTRRSR
jgi:hypothetical protein